MDRASLESFLERGLSLAEIGKRVGRHESTVSYWLKKYGMDAANRDRHTARGGISRDHLEALVSAGQSIAQIANELDRSNATVRHWMMRYGLRTQHALNRRVRRDRALADEADLEIVVLTCRHHGKTEFWLNAGGYYRCKQCRSEAVARRRRKMKRILVAEAGGACSVCGYARAVGALHFHHVDPSEKRHEVNARGAAMSLARLRAEARKCVLLCANCHAEVEAGMIPLPGQDDAHIQCSREKRSHPG